MHIKSTLAIIFTATLILLIPFFAMQVTDEVNWDLFDFVVAWTLLVSAGLAYTFVARQGGTMAYRAATFLAVSTTFLLVW